MQPNSITLAVDVANNATLVNQTYGRYDEYQNRSVYTGPNHSIAAPNTMSFYRTQPKTSGNFKGMAKSAVKFSESCAVTGVDGTSLGAPIILEVSFAVPVGLPAAKQVELRQRAVALLDTDAVVGALMDTLVI